MTEIVESELPGIEEGGTEFVDAPWGMKKDGTPKSKPGRPAGSTGGSGTGSKSKSAKLAALEEELADKIIEASLPLAFAAPLMGSIIEMRAEKTAHALVVIAGNSPRFLKALEKAITYGAVLDLAVTMTAVTAAGFVEFGMMRPDAVIARKLHITDRWIEIYGDGGEEPATNGYMIASNGDVTSRSGLY